MRYLFVCLLASLGSVSLGLDAIAQTAPIEDRSAPNPNTSIPFSGIVPYSCEFSNGLSNNDVIAGVLAPEGNGPIYSTLSSEVPGGSAAEVDLLCNGTSNLEVDEPVQVSGPAVDADTEAFVRTTPNVGTTTSSSSPLEIPPGEVIALTVDMIAEARDTARGFPPADYKYEVTLTTSPR